MMEGENQLLQVVLQPPHALMHEQIDVILKKIGGGWDGGGRGREGGG